MNWKPWFVLSLILVSIPIIATVQEQYIEQGRREISDEMHRKTEIDRANYMRECGEYLGPLTCDRIWLAGN